MASQQCAECEKNLVASQRLACDMCHRAFHPKCTSPKLTDGVINSIKNSKGALTFKCSDCLNSGESSLVSSVDISSKLSALEASIANLSRIVSETVLSQLKDIKDDVKNCAAKVRDNENYVNTRFNQLEIENNSLRRQLNRSDILITGLPSDLQVENIHDAVVKIGDILGVKLDLMDLNVCTYIRRNKSILVKFNTRYKRDILFKSYIANRNLKLNQVIDTDIESRIYINDNLTPVASRLNYTCRRLIKLSKIKKFILMNKNQPEVKVTFNDGSEKTLNLEGLTAITKECTLGVGEK